jgi:hypothetical protein
MTRIMPGEFAKKIKEFAMTILQAVLHFSHRLAAIYM